MFRNLEISELQNDVKLLWKELIEVDEKCNKQRERAGGDEDTQAQLDALLSYLKLEVGHYEGYIIKRKGKK